MGRLLAAVVVLSGCSFGDSNSSDDQVRRPDASKMVDAGPTVPPLLAFSSNRNGLYEVFTANPDGSAVTRLGSGGQPAWSSDGRKLAFADGGIIYTMNRNGSSRTALYAGADPQWSPDGTHLLFTNDDGIVTATASVGAVPTMVVLHDVCMVNGEGMCATPRFSADGTQITYVVANLTNPLKVQVATSTGANPHDLLAPTTNWSDSPTWTLSGSGVVYNALAANGAVDVVRVNSDGSGAVTLVNGFDISVPAIAPNGQDVAYQYSASSTSLARIWIKPATGAAHQLIPDVAGTYEDVELAWTAGVP